MSPKFNNWNEGVEEYSRYCYINFMSLMRRRCEFAMKMDREFLLIKFVGFFSFQISYKLCNLVHSLGTMNTNFYSGK